MQLEPELDLITVSGGEMRPYINDLARLRISVFRDYPYLYVGSEDYERRYLQTYSRSPRAMAVLALKQGRVVGASTGLPMADEEAALQQPFTTAGIDVKRLFYCGESVLLPAYRGRGLYRHFFAAREARAQELGGFESIGFFAVQRAEDDPRRPSDYQPLDPVWRHFGYLPRPDLMAAFPWAEADSVAEINHAMMFWMKSIPNSTG